MASLEGKVIAITGAASGIGLATAHLCASRGASVSLADVRAEPLEAAVSDIQKTNPKAHIFHKTVNVVKSAEVTAWLDETVKTLGPLKGAANLAGVAGNTGQATIQETKDEDWDFILDINLRGVFNCIRAELQRMEKDASIVSASSVAGLRGYQTGAAYCTSKFAVLGLSRTAAIEAAPKNVRVNCIAPGPIDTPMIHQATVGGHPITGANTPLKRTGRPEEVAKLIAFLLSDESTYTTGSCYGIDGGLMA